MNALRNPLQFHGSPIQLKYSLRRRRSALFIIFALLPLWGIWLPYAMFVLASGLLAGMADAQSVLSFSLLVILLAVVLITLLVCLDTRMFIDSEGLSVPLHLLWATRLRAALPWSELSAVVFRKNADEARNQLVLRFGSVSVPLAIAGMSKDDLRKLVLSAQSYCGNAEPEGLLPTYTELWESELNSRFSTTAFVPLSSGDRLKDGGIEVIGQTASGGLSAIYLARLEDGRKVVLKELVTPAIANDATKAKALELFAREAGILRTLEHHRIAKVIDFFREDSRHYLLLEHIAGVDLRRFVRDNGRQHEELVLRWMLEVADILEYLHGHVPPIVHRDLTPDNLIFTTSGGIALIDFGAANAFVSEATGTLIGKQGFMAPEQLKGHAVPESDLYALGCTMHFLLTGMDPEPLAVSTPKNLNDQVSDLCNDLVAHCTHQSAELRLSSAAAAGSRIRMILAARRSHLRLGV